MRPINSIIIQVVDVESPQSIIAEDVEAGMPMVGFHYIIAKNGSVEIGRPLSVIGNHCIGHNANSVGIAVVGDGISSVQHSTVHSLIKEINLKVDGVKNVFRIEGEELKKYK